MQPLNQHQTKLLGQLTLSGHQFEHHCQTLKLHAPDKLHITENTWWFKLQNSDELEQNFQEKIAQWFWVITPTLFDERCLGLMEISIYRTLSYETSEAQKPPITPYENDFLAESLSMVLGQSCTHLDQLGLTLNFQPHHLQTEGTLPYLLLLPMDKLKEVNLMGQLFHESKDKYFIDIQFMQIKPVAIQ
jgi:hypothetical protein